MVVGLCSQFAHQLAAFGGCEPRISGGGYDAVAEQGDGFAWLGTHADLLSQGWRHRTDSESLRRGRLLLVASARPR